ncbi:conserved domain protein [Neorickettsia sennetsu str. Miyayama]|uniref:Conserved domain protein n=1 Tax=Ehrlichia sennetsu (strain ATCC VR-367 / Miyayama) TaxID=222891 RepID=Q2GEW8_EHRS3|nr:conserved domain protein [Neorickettsia sennetsu str. Miyayama]
MVLVFQGNLKNMCSPTANAETHAITENTAMVLLSSNPFLSKSTSLFCISCKTFIVALLYSKKHNKKIINQAQLNETTTEG